MPPAPLHRRRTPVKRLRQRLTETVATDADATTPQRVSLWKFIRLPRSASPRWRYTVSTRRSRLSVSVSRQIELERQISAARAVRDFTADREQPALAPDGKSVVFATAVATTLLEIVIQDIASGAQRHSLSGNARVASPDVHAGRKSASHYWLRRTAPPSEQPDCAIALRDLDREHRHRAGGLPATPTAGDLTSALTAHR